MLRRKYTTHLQFGVGVELEEEVHYAVRLQGPRHDHHMLVACRPALAVLTAKLHTLCDRRRYHLDLCTQKGLFKFISASVHLYFLGLG